VTTGTLYLGRDRTVEHDRTARLGNATQGARAFLRKHPMAGR
jgi:hypothetical protein